MELTRVGIENLEALSSRRSVVVDGEEGVWKVLKVDGEMCLCMKPYLDIGSREERFHYSRLSLAPSKCQGKVCTRGCGAMGQ